MIQSGAYTISCLKIWKDIIIKLHKLKYFRPIETSLIKFSTCVRMVILLWLNFQLCIKLHYIVFSLLSLFFSKWSSQLVHLSLYRTVTRTCGLVHYMTYTYMICIVYSVRVCMGVLFVSIFFFVATIKWKKK